MIKRAFVKDFDKRVIDYIIFKKYVSYKCRQLGFNLVELFYENADNFKMNRVTIKLSCKSK
jgi:hypothetical protein